MSPRMLPPESIRKVRAGSRTDSSVWGIYAGEQNPTVIGSDGTGTR
jgi:hypothetical protein